MLHDGNMAERFCDSIFALHSGRLIAQTSPSDVMGPKRLQEIYGVPMEVMRHAATGI